MSLNRAKAAASWKVPILTAISRVPGTGRMEEEGEVRNEGPEDVPSLSGLCPSSWGKDHQSLWNGTRTLRAGHFMGEETEAEGE